MVYDFLKSDIINQELNIAKVQVKKITTKEEQQANILEWLYLHKFWLFSIAGGIEATLFVIDEAKKNEKK